MRNYCFLLFLYNFVPYYIRASLKTTPYIPLYQEGQGVCFKKYVVFRDAHKLTYKHHLLYLILLVSNNSPLDTVVLFISGGQKK